MHSSTYERIRTTAERRSFDPVVLPIIMLGGAVFVLIGGAWISGTVTGQKDGEYAVETDDGSTVVGVKGAHIRPQKNKKGR